MVFDSSKFNFSSNNIENFSDYDLDYLRMQIRKNSESLEKAIENLRRLADKSREDIDEQKN